VRGFFRWAFLKFFAWRSSSSLRRNVTTNVAAATATELALPCSRVAVRDYENRDPCLGRFMTAAAATELAAG
jgi:hypothetical protein